MGNTRASRESLEAYRGTIEDRVLRFLSSNPHDGFTFEGIAQGTRLYPQPQTQTTGDLGAVTSLVHALGLSQALDNLKRSSRIETAYKDGETYYFIAERAR